MGEVTTIPSIIAIIISFFIVIVGIVLIIYEISNIGLIISLVGFFLIIFSINQYNIALKEQEEENNVLLNTIKSFNY